MAFQRTLKEEIKITGIALHSGELSQLILHPAPPDTGIVFLYHKNRKIVPIPAIVENVVDTRYAVTLGREGCRISTVEHFLAALCGLGIDNLYVSVNSSELPILDGSAIGFTKRILEAGIERQKELKKVLVLDEPAEVVEGDKHLIFMPSAGLKINYTIDFGRLILNKQTAFFDISEESFLKEICLARTFTFLNEVSYLRKNGLAKGGSLDNAIVLTDDDILNDSLRYRDEFVRHKILDLIGDLYLCGYPVRGHIIAYKSGHSLDVRLVRLLRKFGEVIEDDSQEKSISEKDIISHLIPQSYRPPVNPH
ncbi:MAG TPA: UDP-3-O-[3-hydroxymyristoyl] N-acetylglucosamine deacetylase [Firmicutes bacterium]|nr:UDP-3-O-[3-hydroxymyristoyl] N-acetylglucosamine deacetylase [Bacillota bacterium]